MKETGREFSLKTVLMVAIQLIDILKQVHERGFLHGAVGMDNIAIGAEEMNKYIYLIGMENAISCEGEGWGKINDFSSLRTWRGEIMGKRDDLESLGYVIIYMLNLRLPWKEFDSFEEIKSMVFTIFIFIK